MSFIDCILTAQKTGSISEKKVKEATEAYEAALLKAADDGLNGSAAADFAAMEAVKAIDTRTADKRWQRINQIRRQHELHGIITKAKRGKDFQGIVDDLSHKLESAKHTEIGRAGSLFVENLEKYGPKLAGLRQSTADMRDVIYEVFGKSTGNANAKALAKEALAVGEYLRKRANAFGASIHENPNRRLPQIPDRLKVRNAGPDKWVKDHLEKGVLDWDVMEYDGKYIPEPQREKILQTVYQTIITDGYNKLEPGQGRGVGSLATELSRERFLYYKSPDAWLEMSERYGRGNFFQQFIGQIESMAGNIASMKVFGPNPDAGVAFTKSTMKRHAATLTGAEGGGPKRKRSNESPADYASDSLQEQFNIHSRRILNGEENMAATMPATVRTLIGAQALGSAFLSAMGDLGFARHTALMNQMPGIKHMRSYLKYMNPLDKQGRKLAIRSGLVAESAMAVASSYQRYFGPMMGNAVARRISDVTFRTILLTPHTQAAKWAWGMETMGMFADHAGKRWDQLPFTRMLERYGITEADWDLFRKTPVHDPEGAHLLRPNDLFFNATTAAERRVADKFQDMILDTTNVAVPTADYRVLATMGKGVNPGTLRGELLNVVGMVKTFPVLMYTLYGREMMQRSTAQGRLAYLGSFAAFTVLGGAFITQTKAIASGRDFEDMTEPAFWAKAAINGGTFGLMGDLVVNGLEATLGGPVPQTIDDTLNLFKETGAMIGGDPRANPAGEAIKLSSKLIPGSNWWQTKLLLQRAMWDQIMQSADPQAYRRMKQFEARKAKENGNRPFWPIGETSPVRGPNFGAAIGQP